MTNNLKLSISFDVLQSNADKLLAESNEMSKINIENDQQLIELKEKVKDWDNRVLQLLNSSFTDSENEYAIDYRGSNPSYFRLPGAKPNLQQFIKEQKETIKTKRFALWGMMRILSVSDAVIFPERVDLIKRRNYTIEEKLNLLLYKLYILYDDYYYPVKSILLGNGIELKRFDDDRDFAKTLEQYGYVTITFGGIGGNETSARLTTEGAIFVENNIRPEQINELRHLIQGTTAPNAEISGELWNAERLNKYLYEIDECIATANYERSVTLSYTCLEGFYRAFILNRITEADESRSEIIVMSKVIQKYLKGILSAYPDEALTMINHISYTVDKARNGFSESHFGAESGSWIAVYIRDLVNSQIRLLLHFLS